VSGAYILAQPWMMTICSENTVTKAWETQRGLGHAPLLQPLPHLVAVTMETTSERQHRKRLDQAFIAGDGSN